MRWNKSKTCFPTLFLTNQLGFSAPIELVGLPWWLSKPASVQSKLQRKDPASLFLNFMQVQTALPHGTEQHVLVLFFFLPYLSYFECKRRNQRQTLSPKRGEKCAYLPSSSVIYQSVLRAAAHGAPLAHLDLHFVYYVQHPGATVTGIWWEKTC